MNVMMNGTEFGCILKVKTIKGRDYCMLLASKYTLLIISAAAIIATIRVNPSVVMAACPVKSV